MLIRKETAGGFPQIYELVKVAFQTAKVVSKRKTAIPGPRFRMP
ncbi:hypothetical protein ASZ90_017086 [hydrocarbon metagenome]|uniref:Uncharacterized protein n=1 Tax=hydrocarbon metagenome TaxID=938273 RepID=A0A0W8EAL5_9ZZZZ